MGLRFLAIACLVGAAFAGPLQKQSASQCATQCSSSPNQKFDYEIGKAYTYEYRGENVISATGKSKQKASIEGLAVISVVDQCEMVLQLKNLRVQQKLSQEEIQELTQKLETPVPFAFQDGNVEHVCPSQEEDIQSLNIKKGLISAFVNTMSKLDTPQKVKEFDSMGNCSTEYTVRYNNGWEIQKQKSLKSCSKRHSSVTALITNPYQSSETKLNTLPIFPEETLVCTQMIEDKIIKSVECEERAQIKPLSNRESIVKFEGQVKLSLLSISPAERQRQQSNSQQRPQTLLYGLEDHKDVQTQERETQQLLQDMCLKNQRSMDVNVSKDFIQLVHMVKSLPYSSLSSIHSSMKDGRICSSKKVRDLFVDTLPMSGSDSAIKLMVELLQNKEISGLKAKFWPASLALIPNPSRETVSEIIPLLRGKPSSVVLLGVSALVHRFCNMENCDHEPAVQEIASVLRQQLGESCSEENDSQVLAALKAFGNMGYHGEAEHCILACAQNKDKPTRLRLAAIDAFRRIQKKRPEQLMRIYTDEQESSEIRIAAFTSIMRQADESQLRMIKRIAEQEQDNQVSGYAATFIRNMNKTSSPLKQSVKQALKQIEINPPKVKYWENSKNIEFSTFSKTLNMGGSVETDIIHSEESKIPRSITTRFDADILNSNINIFEAGIRAEGLEAIIKNLIGLKDKIPKRQSWNLLSSDNIFGGSEAEASAFIRTMNTEILDLSASDLSAVGEMIKIADLMNQLAQGKSSDFSHSFLFMNSQVIIPSVTGRSYSFGITGSATVGLTASTKLDVMRFPRNTDASAHFQPSFNIELATTVGIQSNKHRPDIKLTTSMHLESDMKAQFKIKEGHLAIASVSLPSENVVLARVSSNIIEIDSQHREEPLFKVMQKKIDYCFDKLQRPTGLSVCGVLEVPKPFVTKSFPFINGIGSIELSIKKSDKQMHSFEFVLEKPRHQTPVRKYKASFDTPGSRFSRRFAAELLVQEQGKGHQEYTLDLISPFKSAGGKGSLTRRSDLVEGALKLYSSSSQLLSVNASAQIASSQVKQVIRPSVQITLGQHEPMKVDGVVSVTNGRKQLISIDFKTNKPSRKPMTLSGTITKEGNIELSKKSEWKISSDLSMSTVFYEAQVRSTIEKQSKQAQTISASFETDYKKGSQKQSIKLSGVAQKSSSKLSTNAQFQSTQFSAANWALKWEMQGKPRRNLRNDITLRYGRNPERSYISIKQNSVLSETGPSQCYVALKVPQYDIDSNLTLKHEIQSESSRKIMLDADLQYKKDKHIKGLLHFDYPSTRPLKASTRVEIQYPSGKVSYADEIEETSTNKFEGQARMQWKENKQVEWNYIYQILSEPSVFHHELETSVKVPSRRSPIKTSASVRLSGESLGLEGSLSLPSQPSYSVQANIKKEGSSQLQIQSPKVDANLKVRNEEEKKAFDFDLRVKSRSPRRVLASGSAQLGQEKSISAEMSWDADRQPEQKMSLASTVQIRGDKYTATTKLQVSDIMSIDLSESGEKSLHGDHEGSLRAFWRNHQPIALEYNHQLSQGEIRSRVKFSQNDIEKFEAKLEGQLSKSSYGRELSAKASLVSLDRSFQNKKLNVEFKQQKSASSTDLQTTLLVQRAPSKTYKAEISSQYHSNGIEASARISTPHQRFSKQAALMSVRKSQNSLSSSLSVELPDSQIISFSSDVQRKSKEISTTVVFKSPFDIVRNVKAHLSLENHRSKKTVFSYLDVNSARIGDVEASMIKSSTELSLQSQVKVSPIPNVPFQGLSMSFKKSRSSMQLSSEVLMQGEQKINLTSQMRRDRSGISLSSSFSSPFSSIQQVNATYKQSRNSIELSASTLYSGNKNVSISSQFSQERSKTSATVSLVTPYKVKDLKAHLSVDKQSAKKSLLAYVDTNGERKGDIEINYLPSSSGMELQCRMKTARSQELSASAKFEKSGKSFLLSSKVVQGASLLLSSSNQQRLRQQSESLENVLLDMEVSRKSSWEDSKYSMRLSGQLSPASVNISTSRSESNALNIDASACRESQQRQCFKVKTVHKALRNAEGYRHYQRVSVECEKSVGQSFEKFATANIIFTASEHDYKSKVVVEYQGKNIGYEARIHRRENEHDHCSFDSHIFMPSKTSRVRASILHSRESLLLEIEAIPDSSIPQKKLGLEMKKEISQQQLSGYIKLSHPKMDKPIFMTCQVQKQGWIPVQGKWELQYSPIKGSRSDSKSLTLELESNLQQQSSGKKSMSYKLYNQDKSIDASLELKKETSRQQTSYGYEWSLKSQSGLKKGGVSVKVQRQQNNQPREIEISYFTPSQDWKVQARPVRAASNSDISVQMLSKGQLVKQITIKTAENCIEMHVQQSGPVLTTSLCINKRVEDAVQFISLEATCHRRECLDMSIGIEPQNPAFMDIKLQWKKEELRSALSEASGLRSLFRDHSLEELEHELKEKINHLKDDVILPVWRDFVHAMKQIKQQKWEQIQAIMRHHQQTFQVHARYIQDIKESWVEWIKQYLPIEYFQEEVIHPIAQSVRCLMDTYFQLALKHIPDVGRIIIDATKEQFKYCLKKFCVTGTFCHDLLRTYERRGMKATKKLLYSKFEQTKQSFIREIEEIESPSDAWNKFERIVRSTFEMIKERLDQYFGKYMEGRVFSWLAEHSKEWEVVIRNQALETIDYIIAKINDIFEIVKRDQDFRTAEELTQEMQRKLKSLWRNKNQVFQTKWQPMKSSFMQKSKAILSDRFQVSEFDPKNGSIMIRMRHPMGRRHIQVVKNAMTAAKQKLQQSVSA